MDSNVEMRKLTVIFFVNDGNLGPVEKGHEILEGSVEVILGWVEVYAELLEGLLVVDPGLDVGNVERLADALYVGPQERVRWTKNRLHGSR